MSTGVITTCAIPDGLTCVLAVEVADGVIRKIRPAPPVCGEALGACRLGLASAEMVYHPERLQHPLKRVGARGGGEWRRVSWDEAMDEIACRVTEISEQYGPQAMAWTVRDVSSLRGGGYQRIVSLIGGTWIRSWGMGDAASPCAEIATFGSLYGGFTWGMHNPKLCLLWGSNPAVTNRPIAKTIAHERKKGCRVVLIDPRSTASSRLADEHLAIRPGTDGALAMGMIQAIVSKGIHDRRFITERTVGPLLVREDNGAFLREADVKPGGDQRKFMALDENLGQLVVDGTPGVEPCLTGTHTFAGTRCTTAFQLLVDEAKAYSLQRVSEITDLPVDVIERLAVEYATRKPAAIYRRFGMQRTYYGDLACRAINTLAAITGNISLPMISRLVLNWGPFLSPGKPLTSLPAVEVYDAISQSRPWPVKGLWVAGHNFVNQMPNMNRLVNEVLPRLDLLVVCDLFMNASARYADFVLPVTSSFECVDLAMPMGRGITYLALQQKVIEPLYESKSDFQIAASLGRKLGLSEYFNKTEEEYLAEVLDSGDPSVRGVTVETLKAAPFVAAPSGGSRKFKTPSGRIEFYVEKLKPLGQEGPTYREPVESVLADKAKAYPLVLLSTHPEDRVHSTLANVPKLSSKTPEPSLEINPADAAARRIGDGQEVRVFNDRGSMRLKAKVTDTIKLGVVNVEQGWWPEHYVEGHHNQLTHDFINPAQKLVFETNVAYYDVLVQVEKALD